MAPSVMFVQLNVIHGGWGHALLTLPTPDILKRLFLCGQFWCQKFVVVSANKYRSLSWRQAEATCNWRASVVDKKCPLLLPFRNPCLK